MDATWAKKHDKSRHGYKNHMIVEAGSKLIGRHQMTTASVSDGTMAWELLDKRDQGDDLHADKGYDREDVKDGVASARMNDCVPRQDRRHGSLSEQEKQRNTELNRVIARVEHVFQSMSEQLGGPHRCAIGHACATFCVKLPGSCYNILRSLHLATHAT